MQTLKSKLLLTPKLPFSPASKRSPRPPESLAQLKRNLFRDGMERVSSSSGAIVCHASRGFEPRGVRGVGLPVEGSSLLLGGEGAYVALDVAAPPCRRKVGDFEPDAWRHPCPREPAWRLRGSSGEWRAARKLRDGPLEAVVASCNAAKTGIFSVLGYLHRLVVRDEEPRLRDERWKMADFGRASMP